MHLWRWFSVPLFLILILFVLSECSLVTFPSLGNSDGFVSVSRLSFQRIRGSSFSSHHRAFDYSYVNWSVIHDHPRDITQDDIFNLDTSAAISKFCGKVQVGIYPSTKVYIPHCKYQTSLSRSFSTSYYSFFGGFFSSPGKILPTHWSFHPTFLGHKFPPPCPKFWSIQLERWNMPALAQNSGAGMRYVEIPFSGGEEKHVAIIVHHPLPGWWRGDWAIFHNVYIGGT